MVSYIMRVSVFGHCQFRLFSPSSSRSSNCSCSSSSYSSSSINCSNISSSSSSSSSNCSNISSI